MDFSHPPIIPQFPQMLEVRPAFGSLFQKLVPGSTVGWLVHSWENGNAASIVWLWYGLQCVIYSVVSCEKCKEGGVWKSVEGGEMHSQVFTNFLASQTSPWEVRCKFCREFFMNNPKKDKYPMNIFDHCY